MNEDESFWSWQLFFWQSAAEALLCTARLRLRLAQRSSIIFRRVRSTLPNGSPPTGALRAEARSFLRISTSPPGCCGSKSRKPTTRVAGSRRLAANCNPKMPSASEPMSGSCALLRLPALPRDPAVAVSGQISSGFVFVNNSQTEIDSPEIEGQNPGTLWWTTWASREHEAINLVASALRA